MIKIRIDLAKIYKNNIIDYNKNMGDVIDRI
jgi:hypothetical protein